MFSDDIVDEQPLRKDKKRVVLELLAPYYKDPSTCGWQIAERSPDGIKLSKGGYCTYLTEDGRMCVLGKCLIDPQKFAKVGSPAHILLGNYGEDILRPEFRYVFNTTEWRQIQSIHDCIAADGPNSIQVEQGIERLALFTVEELQEAAK